MSEDLETQFQRSLDQALEEEKHRAQKWKQETLQIHVSHLTCDCGKPLRDKLISGLLTSSYRCFRNFMFGFFYGKPSESHQGIETIIQTATWRKEHPAVVLFEYLTKSYQNFTVKDIIDCLEEASLYRVIAIFDAQSVQALQQHVTTHKNKLCCLIGKNDGTSHGVSKPLPLPNFSEKSRRVAKGHRGIILLTFLEDGRHHAIEVKETLGKPSGGRETSFIVYTLSNFKSYIMEDVLRSILWIMSQVDYIVPILTEDYFKMLVDETTVTCNEFDEKHAPLVARILQANWASTFKNKRMRCLKPRNVKWPSALICPPFMTAVSDVCALPSILIKSKGSVV